MADYYCDHGAYATVLGATPTWAEPQDGDGSAASASTATATAEIKINALPVADKALTIAGAVITAKSSVSAKNQFAIGASIAACVTNIINLLNTYGTGSNQCDAIPTGVVTTGVPVTRGSIPQVMYARLKGGTTDTIQIMWRYGSDRTNYASNANAAIAASVNWNGSDSSGDPTITQFSGGVGGCYGYLLSTLTMGVSNSMTPGRGVLLDIPTITQTGNALTTRDPIYVRSNRSATLTLSVPTSYYNGTLQQDSTASLYGVHRRIIIDTNTKWSGASDGFIEITRTMHTSNQNPGINFAYGSPESHFSVTCLRRGSLKFSFYNSGYSTTNYCGLYAGVNNPPYGNQKSFELNGVAYHDAHNYLTVTSFPSFSQFGGSVRYINCDFSAIERSTTTGIFGTPLYGASLYSVLVDGCTYDIPIAGAAGDPGPMVRGSYEAVIRDILIRNTHFTGYAAGFSIIDSAFDNATNSNNYLFAVENCTGLSMSSTYWGVPTSTDLLGDADHHQFSVTLPDGSFRYENQRGVAEWIPSASPAFPTLNAVLPDGVTPWSIRFLWVYGVAKLSKCAFVPPMKLFNRNEDGTRTITINLMLDGSLTLFPGLIQCNILYVDVDGVARGETAQIDTSTASWVGASNWPSHVAKQFALTTAHQVKQYTDVTVSMLFTDDPSSGSNESVFIDPEFLIV